MDTPLQIHEGRFSAGEMDALASAICLIVFIVPLLQMLLLSAWLAVIVLKFRLMKYGWRKGRVPFLIAALHAFTAVAAALFSHRKDAHTNERGPADMLGLVPVAGRSPPTKASKYLVLIPGTWDTARENPEYFAPLVEQLGEIPSDTALLVFKWTSTNDSLARTRAAEVLANQLLAKAEGSAQVEAVLVGYSHGGTIAVLAKEQLGDRIHTQVVTASSPIILTGKETSIDAGHATHVYSEADPLIAQLLVSHSARRRQVALVHVLQARLTAAVNSSLWRGIVRMFVMLIVLSILPSFLMLVLLSARAANPAAMPPGVSIRDMVWVDFVVLATLFVLWFRNPIVDTVYKMLRQLLFHVLFTANSPVFAVLFGVKVSDVMAYRYRMREPRLNEIRADAGVAPWAAHRGVLSSQALIDSIRAALRKG